MVQGLNRQSQVFLTDRTAAVSVRSQHLTDPDESSFRHSRPMPGGRFSHRAWIHSLPPSAERTPPHRTPKQPRDETSSGEIKKRKLIIFSSFIYYMLPTSFSVYSIFASRQTDLTHHGAVVPNEEEYL
ncbi:hypothetical protein CDAR_244211 [Caerostris darwini]|uniref:Uncharacterized protein n=1 Tax=Caerostris darwini TaxID=1538125 RepID=A0AAV4REC1_9ARAC|nr:hypothetical protein CDAR_244211 [Caerostris darwini]